MNYFTPELYTRSNSPQYEEVAKALRDWESASVKYKESFQHLRSKMGANQKEFADFASRLHDAEVLDVQVKTADRITWVYPPEKEMRHVMYATFSLRLDDSFAVITYILRRKPQAKTNNLGEVASEGMLLWLYDEFLYDPVWIENARQIATFAGDFEPSPDFVHSILLSDGREIDLPFSDVVWNVIPFSAVKS